MRTKETPPGAPVDDFDALTGDPFLPKNSRLHDRPNADEVRGDIERMSHLYDDLHIDGGFGPVPIGSAPHAAAHDARHELETAMRNRVLFGPTNGDPMQHGHIMATTLENYTKFAPGEERRAITETALAQQDFQDDLWDEYSRRWPEMAADPAATAAAVDHVLHELANWHHYDVPRYVREHREDFLQRVEIAQSLGHGRPSSYDGDANRTYGITTGGSAMARQRPEDTTSDHDFMVELQRQRKIY
jgi:hypothetical protein